MKTNVDHEVCIGCEMCAGICPEVFEMKNDDLAHVIKEMIPKEFEDAVLEAESSCPVEAISHKD